jgi:hypothetical protein
MRATWSVAWAVGPALGGLVLRRISKMAWLRCVIDDLGSVILSYHQLAALINQAKDGPWYAIQKNYARRSTHTTIEVLAYD